MFLGLKIQRQSHCISSVKITYLIWQNKYNCVCCILYTCMKISNLFLPNYFGFVSMSLGIWVKYALRSLLIVKGDYIGAVLQMRQQKPRSRPQQVWHDKHPSLLKGREHRACAALHWQWWRHHVNEILSIGTWNNNQSINRSFVVTLVSLSHTKKVQATMCTSYTVSCTSLLSVSPYMYIYIVTQSSFSHNIKQLGLRNSIRTDLSWQCTYHYDIKYPTWYTIMASIMSYVTLHVWESLQQKRALGENVWDCWH